MGILDIFRKKEQVYNPNNIERFIEVQDKDYEIALSEIRSGRKEVSLDMVHLSSIEGAR